MEITLNKQAPALTIALKGRLDTNTASQLSECLDQNLADITDLTVDLKELDYLSSAGLRVILSAQKTMNKKGSMTVTNVSALVMEVFEVTGFVDILTIK